MSLCFHSWFTGLLDGEGYFQIARIKSKYRAGEFIYIPMAGIGMRKDDTPILRMIKNKLGIGGICFAKRTQSEKHMPKCIWQVSGTKQCRRLVEFLEPYPLQSKKSRDYIVWRSYVIQKSELGYKMPISLSEYYYHRIKEARQYNPIVASVYEKDSRINLPKKGVGNALSL